MNYMKMVYFEEIAAKKVSAKFIFKENEAVNGLDKPIIVPYYLVLEAIFQTAGKVAREYANNKCGGTIVSFSGLRLKRPVFSNELITIRADLISFNEFKKCFFLKINLAQDQEEIISQGEIFIIQDEKIQTQYLNNREMNDKEYYLNQFGF